jgi:hypothetical protein
MFSILALKGWVGPQGFVLGRKGCVVVGEGGWESHSTYFTQNYLYNKLYTFIIQLNR